MVAFGSAGLKVVLNDHKGLSQPKQFHDSMAKVADKPIECFYFSCGKGIAISEMHQKPDLNSSSLAECIRGLELLKL